MQHINIPWNLIPAKIISLKAVITQMANWITRWGIKSKRQSISFGNFCVCTGESCKMIAKKEPRFPQLYVPCNNLLPILWIDPKSCGFFIAAGILTVTLHAISRPPWTRCERQKFVDVSVAITFTPRSNINLAIWDNSLGKCPTVRKSKRTNTYC